MKICSGPAFAFLHTRAPLLATIKLRAISLLNTYQHKSVVQLNALKMKRKIEFPPPFLRAPLEMRIKLLSRCFLSYNNNTTNYSCRRKTTNSLSPSWWRRSIFAFRIFLFAAQQNQDDTIFSLTPDSLKKPSHFFSIWQTNSSSSLYQTFLSSPVVHIKGKLTC